LTSLDFYKNDAKICNDFGVSLEDRENCSEGANVHRPSDDTSATDKNETPEADARSDFTRVDEIQLDEFGRPVIVVEVRICLAKVGRGFLSVVRQVTFSDEPEGLCPVLFVLLAHQHLIAVVCGPMDDIQERQEDGSEHPDLKRGGVRWGERGGQA
jgi:hypothetical protein